MTEMALQLQQISVTYSKGQIPVLDQFSLAVPKGKLACLLGPSGCGKTTVLRAIAGFERICHGDIFIARQHVAGSGIHLPPEKRHTGMVFQDYALFPHLRVAENVAFGLRRLSREEQRERVSAYLELVDLQGYEQRYPHELSGGQQQRIALARSLATRPQILLLDEPFSGLDQKTRTRLGADVRDILRAAGQTALMVTHSEQEAQLMADQTCYMEKRQRVVEDATNVA